MDIQTSTSAGQHNNVAVSGDGNSNKSIYDQHSLSQQHSSQIHQQPIQQQNHDQQLPRPPDQQQNLTEENVSHESTIPIRNIKVDPETLPQLGQDTDQQIHMQEDPRVQHTEGNFVPDVELGGAMGSQSGGNECSEPIVPSNSSSTENKTIPDMNLKNESIGDFNAFHEQIQTVDPLLLWSMVRSRVVPQVR